MKTKPSTNEQLREEIAKRLILAILEGGGHSTDEITKEFNAILKVFKEIIGSALAQKEQEVLEEVEIGVQKLRDESYDETYDDAIRDVFALLDSLKSKKTK